MLVYFVLSGFLSGGAAAAAAHFGAEELYKKRANLRVSHHEDEEALAGFSGPSAGHTARLRRRSRWVRAFQAALGGEVGVVAGYLTGRWTPDLPCQARSVDQAFLLSLFRHGGRVLGGGSVARASEGEPPGSAVYYHVQLPDGAVLTVFPALVATLSQLASFRKRDGSTLSVLRHRAIRWFKENGMDPVEASFGFYGSIALGMYVPVGEETAGSWLRRHKLASSLSDG